MGNLLIPDGYIDLLKQIKARIVQAQTRAVFAVNAELVRLYWDIGRLIDSRQKEEGWGAAVIPRLSRELKNELTELKGFSERNMKSMVAFFEHIPIRPQLCSKLLHNCLHVEKCSKLLHNCLRAKKCRNLPQNCQDHFSGSSPGSITSF